jgi:hypothetical protein
MIFLRRKQAGEYLKTKYGFGSEKTLAKLACVGGGPQFRKAGTATLYEPSALDTWALSKIGAPKGRPPILGPAKYPETPKFV